MVAGGVTMADTDVLTEMVLVQSERTAVVHAPIEQVDIAEWLLNLPDAEYQRCCPPDHIAAGSTTTDDGRPMSINVEEIGGGLMVQHYVAEVHQPHHCRMVSLTDAQTPLGWTKIQVIWDLSVTALDPTTCKYTHVASATPRRPSWTSSDLQAGLSRTPPQTVRQPPTTTTGARPQGMRSASNAAR
jgi:hypothetical protein